MNENFRLIGLTGPARSGKDTAADVLKDNGFHRYALASPLKKGLRVMLGLNLYHTDGELKEEPIAALGGVTPRKLMQTLGTEWARHNIHDDVWLWLAEAEWRRQQEISYRPGMVITDVRFENEAKFIRDRGGEVWHIERPGYAGSVSHHVSENGVPYQPGDQRIVNSGSLDELQDLVESLV